MYTYMYMHIYMYIHISVYTYIYIYQGVFSGSGRSGPPPSEKVAAWPQPHENLKNFPRPKAAAIFDIYTTESDFPSSKNTQTNHQTTKNSPQTVIDTGFLGGFGEAMCTAEHSQKLTSSGVSSGILQRISSKQHGNELSSIQEKHSRQQQPFSWGGERGKREISTFTLQYGRKLHVFRWI